MPCILENTHQNLSTKPLPGASTTLVENFLVPLTVQALSTLLYVRKITL